jgi:hypothetical protein
MITLTEITDDPNQKFTVQLEDNSNFTLELEFIEQQEQWIMNISNIPNSDKIINGHKIVSSINLLNQFSRIIPFGVLIETKDGDDPFRVDDFLTGRATFNILNSDEVDEVRTLLATP